MRIFPPQHTEYDKGHGRIECRSIQTSTALNDYLDFPYLKQVMKIERIVTDLNGKLISKEIACGLTSLSDKESDTKKLLALNRGHWEIENKLHYVRDMVFDEDRSRIRKGQGAHVMAIFRNLVVNILRCRGVTNISEMVQKIAWNKKILFSITGHLLYGTAR